MSSVRNTALGNYQGIKGMDAGRDINDELAKVDEDLYLDLQVFVEGFRKKLLPLMPSERAVTSLHRICDRPASDLHLRHLFVNVIPSRGHSASPFARGIKKPNFHP